MTVKTLTWALENSPYTLGARLVHFVLADKANDDHDYELWMRQERIAELAKISVRQVQRAIAQMVEDGYLEVLEAGGGRGKPTRMRLIMKARQNVGVSDDETTTSATRNDDICDAKNTTSSTSLCLLTQEVTQENTKGIGSKLIDFDAFWSIYPRKAGKGQARTAWAKAIKKTQPAVIIDAAARYRDDPNREDEFTAHAATWLNGERWADDALPARNGSRAAPRRRSTSRYADESLDELLTRAAADERR